MFSGLVFEVAEDEEEEEDEEDGLGCESTGRRLNDGGNGWVGPVSEAMDFSICEAQRLPVEFCTKQRFCILKRLDRIKWQ